MAPRKPTIRAVWLGQELRKVRDEANLSVRELSGYIGINHAIISKMETGKMPASREAVSAYIQACGVEDPKRRADLFTVCREAARKGWWDGYSEDVAGGLMDRIWLESKSTRIRTFEPVVIPGLLQTPDYARAVMSADQPDAQEDDRERWLEVRMTRQNIVTRHGPIAFETIIDEGVLHRAARAVTAARQQLDYLIEVSQREHVTVRVLPHDAGLHASHGGGFEILNLEDPYPEAGLLSTPTGEVCVEGSAIETLAQKYDRLSDVSLDPAASRELIIAERDKL